MNHKNKLSFLPAEKKESKLIVSFIILVFFTFSSCSKEGMINNETANSLSSDIATQWIGQAINLTKYSGGFTPPVASRAFGYCGLTLWESIAQQTPNATSISDQLSAPVNIPKIDVSKNYYPPACVNAAMYFIVKKLYANAPVSLLNSIDSLYQANNVYYLSIYSENTINNSNTYGTAVATAIYDWSKADGGHESYLTNTPINYISPSGLGFWEPTTSQRVPIQPYWGNNRTFIKNLIGSIPVPVPENFSTDTNSLYYKEAKDVYTASLNLSKTQQVMADFWNDATGMPGTPPGHSMSIIVQIIKKEKLSLARAASLICKAGIGVSDAFVSCWNCKYKYNRMRPVTYIKRYIDSTWNSYIQTPNFPEYTSGHSTQSGAIAEILTAEFGDNYNFSDATHQSRNEIDGTPRNFNSFYEFANECANSRFYGGIHYKQAITVGLDVGKKIGTEVNKLNFHI